MVKTILIDLDETLVQSEKATADLFEKTAETVLKGTISGSDLRKAYRKYCLDVRSKMTFHQMLEQIGAGRYDCFYIDDIPEIKFENIFKYRGAVEEKIANELKIEKKNITEVNCFLKAHWLEFYKLYDDAQCFLDAFSSCNVFIATNGLASIQYQKIRKFNLEEMVDGAFVSQDFGVGKPNSYYFNSILKIIKQEPEEVVMIGDSISTDIEGAQMSGVNAIHICRTNSHCEKTRFQVANLSKAKEVLVDVFNVRLS